MVFGEFFDLVRQFDEAGAETARQTRLAALEWNKLPSSWVLLGLEHCAVMIDRWNRVNVDDPPTFWIGVKQKTYKVITRRIAVGKEIGNATGEQAEPQDV